MHILFMNVFASIMHRYVIIVICYVMWICVSKEMVKLTLKSPISILKCDYSVKITQHLFLVSLFTSHD